jgi:hypothetical protein
MKWGLVMSKAKLINKYEDLAESIKDRADTRYNTPKEDPKGDYKDIENVTNSNEIYKRAKLHILKAQNKQVGYGLDKYPEPLNANTWSMIETIDHIIDESVDKLHYLVMLRIKLEDEIVKGNQPGGIVCGYNFKEAEENKKPDIYADDKRIDYYA